MKVEIFLKEMSLYTKNIIPYYIERWQCYEVDDVYDFISIEAIMGYRYSIEQ